MGATVWFQIQRSVSGLRIGILHGNKLIDSFNIHPLLIQSASEREEGYHRRHLLVREVAKVEVGAGLASANRCYGARRRFWIPF